jgi:hypothetical protein
MVTTQTALLKGLFVFWLCAYQVSLNAKQTPILYLLKISLSFQTN